MAQWTVGDCQITTIGEGSSYLPCDFLYPGATPSEVGAIPWLREPFVQPDGSIHLRIQTFLIQTPQTRIVVDTCMGNDKTRPSGAGHLLATDYLDQLAAAGSPRESVDVVLCTHF